MKQEIKIVRERKECRACNLGVFGGGCDCYWYDDTITVYTCINNACNISHDILHALVDTVIGNKIKIEIDTQRQIIYKRAQEKRTIFNENFRELSIPDKLACYGLPKLCILCKRYKIKKYKTYDKQKLIELLSPIVTIQDFPIRE